ncbi:MAG TPA: VWA domain-containing protein [Bryobacteraceae bacterium]|jgi:Ca-activated chloride channel family protein|nr:VWA domain-containing protein [Bryobacteraceae bacterium]
MRRWLLNLSLGFTAVFAALAQSADIRVDVNLVRVVTTVKNAAGDPVGSLSKTDFTVFDNNVPQQIAVFERHTEQPLSVALLIDTSGSTAKDLKYEVDSISRFLHALFAEGNPKDTVALFSFNYQVVKHNHFTRNAGPIERSLHSLHGEAGTSLYDAIYLAAGQLENREGRRIMVIVTDGGDTTSNVDFHAALEAAQLADGVIYPILVVPIANDAGRNVGGEHALTTLALGTGGHVFAPTLGAELDAAFTHLIGDLRTQYVLAFYPRDVPLTKNRFHRLEVRVANPQLRVLARNGYYGEAENSSGSPRGRTSVAPKALKQQEP